MTSHYRITRDQFCALERIYHAEPYGFLRDDAFWPQNIHQNTWYSLKRRGFTADTTDPYSDEVRLTEDGRRAMKQHRLRVQRRK